MDYSGYQIALIAILVINLVFWSLVVCFRLFFDCSCSDLLQRDRRPRRSNRRQVRLTPRSRNPSENQLMGLRNPAFMNLEEIAEPGPYNIMGVLDPPPSYEDALQSTDFHSNSPSYLNHTCRSNFPGRPVHAYTVPVVLSVPEETTSTSEVRLQTSLNPTQAVLQPQASQRQLNGNQLPTATGDIAVHNENNNAESPCIMTEDNSSLTFVVNGIGKQSLKAMGIKEMSTTLADGEQLETQSKV